MSRHKKFKNSSRHARRGQRVDAGEGLTRENSPQPSCTREVVQPSRRTFSNDPHRPLAILACRYMGGRFRQTGKQFEFTVAEAAREFGYLLFVNRWKYTSRPAKSTITVGEREP